MQWAKSVEKPMSSRPTGLDAVHFKVHCAVVETFTALAYYVLLRNIFHDTFFPAKRQVESSLAFYDKVVDIWYKFLASVRNDASVAENVGKAQLSEGMDMLTRVLNTRINLLGDNHIATVSATQRCKDACDVADACSMFSFRTISKSRAGWIDCASERAIGSRILQLLSLLCSRLYLLTARKGEARCTLGLLHLFVADKAAAVQHLTSASEIYTHHLVRHFSN